MKKILFTFLLFVIFNLVYSIEPHFMEDPAISPDGTEVCFSYMNDLWIVPFDGGEAKRITVSDAYESDPVYSADGKYIFFNSNRNGFNQIFRISASGGEADIYSKEDFKVIAVFPKSILASGYEPGFYDKFIRVDFNNNFEEITKWGGYYSDVSQDGRMIIFSKRGYPYREAYKGSANGDLWLYNIKDDSYKRLTDTPLTERYPVFSKINKNRIYFAASDGKVFQLYKADINDLSKRKQLTKFKIWSARDISIARKNDRIVFERFDKIWKFDPQSNKASELKISINQDYVTDYIKREDVTNKFNNFAVSDDGKLVVFSYKFDLFAMPEKGGDVIQLTHSQSGIEDIIIMDDNKTIFFTSRPNGKPEIFKVNIKNPNKISKMKWKKYVTSIKKQQNYLIINYDTDKKKSNLAFADSIGYHIKVIEDEYYVTSSAYFSPDKKYALYQTTDPEVHTKTLWAYNFESKEKKKIVTSYRWTSGINWGKDGKTAFISFYGDIFRIDLQSKDDFYLKKNYWKEILEPKEETKKDKKKDKKKVEFKIDFNNIENRLTKIIARDGDNFIINIPNDSMFYYINVNNGKSTLRKSDYLGENDEKVHSFNSEIWSFAYNKENKVFYFIEDKNLKKINPKSDKVKSISNKFSYKYDDIKLNKDIFKQVWTEFGENYADPNMNGVNWEKEKERYLPVTSYLYQKDMLKAVIDEMIGDVNSSHTGFYPKKENKIKGLSKAYLGCVFDYKNFSNEGIRIEKIYNDSKLREHFDIKEGDILLEVDGVKVGRGLPFSKLFHGKVDKKIKLKIKSGNSIKSLEVKGINSGKNYTMYYNDWVLSNKKKVDELSNGEFAYIHIRAMDWGSYKKFIDDLYSKNLKKKALILDLRNNGGGNTHEAVLSVLRQKNFGFISQRRFDAKKYKAPYQSWDKPIVLLINENSFSDAEIFPTIFKELKMGKIIGMPTSGYVIGTYYETLMDGSGMRLPSNAWFRLDKTNMEGNAVIPDILIYLSPKDMINHNDKQLKKAVKELFKELKE